MRNTRQRDAVLRALTEIPAHPTAQELYDMVRRDVPQVGLATVYRLLRSLEDDGIIASVDAGDGHRRFDGHPGGHHHVVCSGCHCIVDVPELVGANARAEIERRTGFVVDAMDCRWSGLCPDCRRNGGSCDAAVARSAVHSAQPDTQET